MDGRRARRVLDVAFDTGPDEVRRAFRAMHDAPRVPPWVRTARARLA
jgi:hypothetical protein